jgi:hypothetical protein
MEGNKQIKEKKGRMKNRELFWSEADCMMCYGLLVYFLFTGL